ncbi:MAG: hypothetical protein U9M97_04090, partial [Candidatus Hadarchaeota archaeon]|nr:hypothetical protein [Candidatus Hadarchaeota archaeon]
GVNQPFFIALDKKMRVLNDSLEASFAVMKFQNRMLRSIILTDFDKEGENTMKSILRKMGLKIHRNKIRTDLRNLERDRLATYDPYKKRFALSGNGHNKLTRPLLGKRTREIGTRL